MLASLELYGRDSSVTRIEAGSRARDWKHLLAEFLAGSGSGELGCIMRPCQSRQLRFCAIRALCARARARARGERKPANFLERSTALRAVFSSLIFPGTATLDTHHFKRIRLQSSRYGTRLPLNICFTSCLPRRPESNQGATCVTCFTSCSTAVSAGVAAGPGLAFKVADFSCSRIRGARRLISN